MHEEGEALEQAASAPALILFTTIIIIIIIVIIHLTRPAHSLTPC
jgi:formate-dependent nitrite reductase membrane component NrfD